VSVNKLIPRGTVINTLILRSHELQTRLVTTGYTTVDATI